LYFVPSGFVISSSARQQGRAVPTGDVSILIQGKPQIVLGSDI